VKIVETTFGKLKRGDRFALGPGAFLEPTDHLMNIKVDPALLCGEDQPLPFNVICLGDGRVRTFRDEEKVLVKRTEARTDAAEARAEEADSTIDCDALTDTPEPEEKP